MGGPAAPTSGLLRPSECPSSWPALCAAGVSVLFLPPCSATDLEVSLGGAWSELKDRRGEVVAFGASALFGVLLCGSLVLIAFVTVAAGGQVAKSARSDRYARHVFGATESARSWTRSSPSVLRRVLSWILIGVSVASDGWFTPPENNSR